MAKVLTDPRHYSAIAEAIRAKGGTTAQLRPDEMAAAIEAIQTGGGGGAPGLITTPPLGAQTLHYGISSALSFNSIRVNGRAY